ncbi:MAG: XrtA-associated tyrosine autokinase [Acidobacteriota bacterium]
MSRIEDALNKAVQSSQGKTMPRSGASAPRMSELKDMMPPVPTEHTLLALTEPRSHVAEEFRKLKEAIIKESSREGFNNVLLVTSANPQEGKSVTALNLALSLAQEIDYTVLLVDADLRAPSCHRYLGITPEVGLSDCLEGKADCADALVRIGVGRLVLLPAGKALPNPSELLSSNKMRQLLQELKHRYPDRFIFIDSPPANMFAETRALAAMADASILVVREGETSLDSISEAIAALDHRVMGIVYNDAREMAFGKPSQYGHYLYAKSQEAGQ